ncbi:choice-of-anchor tandem repeat GloVer-containing protein [Ideonella sp.]|uniref:choice-of-anchor tandem repeat GloVer-containing protein n=1 Tax=Ideonella sp. TaxID=1929293 RepID=UPI002B480E58|nr:choice-of-anchor tandem repeat GloVer-containing protein [Ideonella sp.]HJV70571.1 choice-of-anchor tandem repeat GloVer-containing protein [Ideonella sp.]
MRTPQIRGGIRCLAIFRMKPAGELKVLHSFTGSADGDSPSAALVEGRDGALYGTSRGIASQIVFRITRRGTFNVLHTMKADQSEGAGPPSQMLQARDGYLYGTPPWGGKGTIFKVTDD